MAAYTKKQLMDALEGAQDDDPIAIVIKDDVDVDEVEGGDVLDITTTGYVAGVGHVLYIEPR